MAKGTLVLPSGFVVDFANLVGLGVSEADIASIDGKLANAHNQVAWMRETGMVTGHLSKDGAPEAVLFSQLPYINEENINSPQSIKRLQEFGQSLRYHTDVVVSFGIGGSYLGNKVLFDVQCGEFWNQKSAKGRDGYPQMYFSGNNLDPRHMSELIAQLEDTAWQKRHNGQGPLAVTLVVISKSGSTLETMADFMAVYERLRLLSALFKVEVVAVTGIEDSSVLYKLATTEGWQIFAVPEGVGGRFSVFSNVGLITGVAVGLDIEAFLAGAKAMDEACQSADVWQNPAMLNAALKFLAAEKLGRDIEVFMPYADYLKSTAEWYIQLLAESLGKRVDRQGNEVHYGRTPIVAVGTTDMHAQTQQHQEGKLNKVVQFVRVAAWKEDFAIPDCFPDLPKLHDMAGVKLSAALEAARAANAEALAEAGRFSAVFSLPELNAFHLGELLYLLALSVAYEGELADVDAFDQPGVENYKRLLVKRRGQVPLFR